MRAFLKEKNGSDSSARLIFTIGSIWNMLLTTYLVLKNIDVPIILAYFTGVEAVLIGLKLGQKPMEK